MQILGKYYPISQYKYTITYRMMIMAHIDDVFANSTITISFFDEHFLSRSVIGREKDMNMSILSSMLSKCLYHHIL